MSETYLRFIPVVPDFVPRYETIDGAVAFLQSSLPGAEKVDFRLTGHIEFIDSGSLFERIHCPSCGHEMPIEWWDEMMERTYSNHFQNLTIQSSCCKHDLSLNDLIYDQPQGFARFILEVRLPEVLRLDPEIQTGLEKTLGGPLRLIWAQYE